jgi:hypothetical protein
MIVCCTSYVIQLYVFVSESMCMKVCMIVCCPVYIVVRLMLFHYRCVSVRACIWKFVWLCFVLYILSYVLCYFTIGVCQLEHVHDILYDCVSCPVYIVVRLMLFHYRCVSVRACALKFVWLCVLSCIYCCTSCVISLYVCVSESMCMKVCMIVCLVLYILSYVLCYFIIGVCQWEHVYERLYDCVLSCIYCRTSYVISL